MKLIVKKNFFSEKIFKKFLLLKLSKTNKDKIKVYPHTIKNNKVISKSFLNEKFIIEIHKKYHPIALNFLKKICPNKVSLYDYSVFNLIETGANYKFPIHDDTPNKLLSGVIYLHPKKNTGTIFYNQFKKKIKTIKWEPNKAIFFSRDEKKTWHSYEGDKINNRVVFVYNLMTDRLKEVYKVENKSYLIGLIRYKLNPILYKYLKLNF